MLKQAYICLEAGVSHQSRTANARQKASRCALTLSYLHLCNAARHAHQGLEHSTVLECSQLRMLEHRVTRETENIYIMPANRG